MCFRDAKRPSPSELCELRGMLKAQQEQLNQLTKSISLLQGLHQCVHSVHCRPVVCKRCQQPDHFARECEAVRAAPASLCPILGSIASSPPGSVGGKLAPAELPSHTLVGGVTGSKCMISDLEDEPTERNMANYSSMKLDFLALKWAMMEKCWEYLLGQRCMVLTDNNPLRATCLPLSSVPPNNVGQPNWLPLILK